MLYSSLFPSSRHHGPLLLQSSGPARCSRTGSRYFSFLSCDTFSPSFSPPCNLSLPAPLALFSVLHHGLPPVNVSIVVGCHAALRSPPFWLNGHNRRNFSRAQGDSSTPCRPIFFLLLPLSLFSSVPVPLFFSPLCSRTAGSDRVVNRLSVAFHTEQV